MYEYMLLSILALSVRTLRDTEHQIKWEEHPVFLDTTPTQPTAINCDISQLNFAELASDWS